MALAPERQTILIALRYVAAKNPQWVALDDNDKSAILRRIERSCYNTNIAECMRDGVNRVPDDPKYIARYSAICYRIQSNMDASAVGSSYLLDSMILFTLSGGSKGIDPAKVAEINSNELCPDANRAVRDTIELRLKQKMEYKVSDAHTCKKCEKKCTVRIQFQGRSADEANSTSIKCVACGHIWPG
jgi:DNA-directed RNA polymerase subunit M/transcription elongation factor TFIIS